MSETASAHPPESEAPKKGLGDRFAETWEEVIKIVLGMSGEQAQARSTAARNTLRETKETKVDPSTPPEVK